MPKRFPLALTLSFLGACGGEAPPVPSVSTATVTTTPAATVASTVGAVPSVKITDAKGRAVKNVLVRWRVASGGGTVKNDSVRTAPSGEATSGGWTLGTVAGMQTLTASADGVPLVTFTATAAPGAPTRLALVAGGGQRAAVNTTLPVAPSVRVEDRYGNAVPNTPVTYSVLFGGGAVDGATTVSNAQGIATLGGWRLGTTSGDQSIHAVVTGLPDITFTAVAEPGPAVSLTITAGETQDGASRAPSPSSPSVRLVDSFGNGIGNAPVAFTPGAESGTVSVSTALTDGSGVASVTWTLGTAAQQTLSATSSALAGRTATFTASAFASDYDIEVRFVGNGGTIAQRDAFAKSVVRWRRVLSQQMHNTRIVAPAGECDSWMPALNETVNDLVIYARLVPIDGVGRILGQAGPCYVNGATRLPALGVMEFDVDDLQNLITNGTLNDVVLHEVGHVLGIGTLWNELGRTLVTGIGGADPFFTGVAARAEFAANGGLQYTGTPVPVENTGLEGTRDSHWRQTIFGRELMQGFSSRGLSPMSATTVASLADLGYRGVRLVNADPFTFFAASFFESPAAMTSLTDDIANTPLIEISGSGARRVLRTRGQR